MAHGVAFSVEPNIARIRVSKSISKPVKVPAEIQCSDGYNPSLEEYMQLPATQYMFVPMPMNANLTRVDGTNNTFLLNVPPVKFKVPGMQTWEAWPEIMVTVTTKPDRVVITADNCTIWGSDIIENLNLNDKFDYRVCCNLTWTNQQFDGEQENGMLTADTSIELYLDPPGVLARIPRKILEAVGNFAISLGFSRLQSDFIGGLAQDYEKWAHHPEYRLECQKKYSNKDNGAQSSVETGDSEKVGFWRRMPPGKSIMKGLSSIWKR
jgi:hypothetical protein